MALKRIDPLVDRRRLGRLRLWRDDLAALADLVRAVDDDMAMTADGYQMETVDDLAEFNKPRIDDFEVTAQGGRIRLHLARRAAVLEIQDPDMPTRGLAGEIERIAASRRLRSATVPLAVGILLAAAVIGLGTALLIICGTGDRTFGMFNAMVWGVLGGIVVPVFVSSRRGDRAIIYTKTRAEAPPWLERNRDGLVTNVVVSVVFYVLGLLTTYVVSLLQH